MDIKLQESLRAIFYAPFYVALARDAFAAEGVEIEFVSSPRPQGAALRLVDGTVDVCRGGPMRVMKTYQKVPGCDIVCFAEVVRRDPFLLVRTPAIRRVGETRPPPRPKVEMDGGTQEGEHL
jgi:NitT/TauT family transport system substrate-binding protein